jgi:IclR family transcriptional regulator, acetate operon repressor
VLMGADELWPGVPPSAPTAVRGWWPGQPGRVYGSAMQDSRAARDNAVQAVDRAISILQVLARHGTAGVTEIAGELGMHKSTAFRLLATLDARGLVEQNAERGRYQLGYGVVQLAAGATKTGDRSLLGLPLCRQLAEAVGETVNVAVHDGRCVVTVDQVIGSATVTTVNWVGQRSPVHATSAGKVFLAHLPPDQVDVVLAERLERYTPHTVVDPVVLRQQLGLVRERGFACTIDEHEMGLAAVAAPIRSIDGGVVAAVTVSGPTFRVNQDTIPGLAAHVLAAAGEISQRMGHPKRG